MILHAFKAQANIVETLIAVNDARLSNQRGIGSMTLAYN
jgi:hypothetical protein